MEVAEAVEGDWRRLVGIFDKEAVLAATTMRVRELQLRRLGSVGGTSLFGHCTRSLGAPPLSSSSEIILALNISEQCVLAFKICSIHPLIIDGNVDMFRTSHEKRVQVPSSTAKPQNNTSCFDLLKVLCGPLAESASSLEVSGFHFG